MHRKNAARNVSSKNRESAAVAPEETRQKLLVAARAVFVEVGFYDATIREICKRAGVNIALVNYHFGDKLGLYTEVLKSAKMIPMFMLDRVNDPTADPVELLRELIRARMRSMATREHAFNILMQQERLKPTPATRFLIEETMRHAYGALCTLIGRILQLPAEDQRCRLAAQSIIGQVKHFGEPERVLSQLDPTILSGKTPDEIADFISDFSLSYLQSTHSRTAPNRSNSVRKQKSKVRSMP